MSWNSDIETVSEIEVTHTKTIIPLGDNLKECTHPDCHNKNLHVSKKGNKMVVCSQHLRWLFDESKGIIKEVDIIPLTFSEGLFDEVESHTEEEYNHGMGIHNGGDR